MDTQKLSFDDFKNIIVERLGCEAEQVTMDASFQEDLNADSLDLVELIYAFEENTGLEIPDEGLRRARRTHSSFANESPHVSPRDNERLEYLGDAVLQLITAEYLFKLRPGSKEGEMTQIRSAMVNNNTLAALGEELGLGSYLDLGQGIARGGGRSLKSLLANAFEAVLGAVFLVGGYDAAYHYSLARFSQR